MEAVGCAGWQEKPNEWTARRRRCSAFDLEVLESSVELEVSAVPLGIYGCIWQSIDRPG